MSFTHRLFPRSPLSHRSIYRQFATLHTANLVRLRHRDIHPPTSLCCLHVRTASYSSIPRSVARAFRVPIVCIVVVAGGVSYANYKFNQLCKKIFGWVSTVQDAAKGVVDSASHSIKSSVAHVKLPNIEVPQFLKNLSTNPAADLPKKTADWISTVQSVAKGVVDSASNGIKSVSVADVKLPIIETPQFLKNIFPPGVSSDPTNSAADPPKKTADWISTIQNVAKGVVDSASDGIKSVSVTGVKLPIVETPQFIKNLFSGTSSDAPTDLRAAADLHERTTEGLSTVQDAAKGVVDSASDGLKSVKLSDIETTQFLKDTSSSDDSTHYDNGSSSQDSGNPCNSSSEENTTIVAPPR